MNVLRHFISDSSPTFYVVVLHKRFFLHLKFDKFKALFEIV